MSDDATAPGPGTKFATDEIGGTHWPFAKLVPVKVGEGYSKVVTGIITAHDAVVANVSQLGALRSGASTAGSLVPIQLPPGGGDVSVLLKNSQGSNICFEMSFDSTNGTDGSWCGCLMRHLGWDNGTISGDPRNTADFSANAMLQGTARGAKWFRVRCTTVLGVSDTPNITIRASQVSTSTSIDHSFPAGNNFIGQVSQGDLGGDNAFILSGVNSGGATIIGPDQFQNRIKYAKLYMVFSIFAGAPTVTLTVQGKEPQSGTYYDIISSTAIAVAGLTVLTIGPGLTAVANLVANDFLPPTWRLKVAIGGGGGDVAQVDVHSAKVMY
jgi:hypothetical protein